MLTTVHKWINQSHLYCAKDLNRWSQWYSCDLKISGFMVFFLSLHESLKHLGPVFHRTVQIVPTESLWLLPGKAWPLIFLLWKSKEGEFSSSIINGVFWLVLTALESCPQSDGWFIKGLISWTQYHSKSVLHNKCSCTVNTACVCCGETSKSQSLADEKVLQWAPLKLNASVSGRSSAQGKSRDMDCLMKTLSWQS